MTTVSAVTNAELKAMLIDQLAMIAPEADFDALSHDVDVRETLDIDSFDFLNFLIALNDLFGVEIPEADYGQLVSLNDIAGYLQERME